MESFMICTAPHHVLSLMKEDEMEMSIWEFLSMERGKQDFGGGTVGKEATWNIQA
jgi:hypothetical protein